MFKRRGVTLILLSLVLAVGAAWIARGWVRAHLHDPTAQAQSPVVVATLEIPFGEKVQSRYLSVIRLPKGAPIGDAFGDPKQVTGMIALEKILPGEILLKRQFTKKATGSLLAAMLPPDMRAITVHVNDVIGVAGFLLPGNHVDVVEARMVDQRAVTRTVLQDLLVLAVDQTDSRNKNSPVVVQAVTLEVSPQQADILVKATTEGRIQLTLRSPNAINTPTRLAVRTPPRRRRRIAHPIRVAAHRPTDHSIIIIRGTDVQRVRSSG